MEMKPSSTMASVLLGLISLMQLIRFVLGWVVTVTGVVIPVAPGQLFTTSWTK